MKRSGEMTSNLSLSHEQGSERSECRGAHKRSELWGASKQMSGASEWANGRASCPGLQSIFLAVIDHSGLHFVFWIHDGTKQFIFDYRFCLCQIPSLLHVWWLSWNYDSRSCTYVHNHFFSSRKKKFLFFQSLLHVLKSQKPKCVYFSQFRKNRFITYILHVYPRNPVQLITHGMLTIP